MVEGTSKDDDDLEACDSGNNTLTIIVLQSGLEWKMVARGHLQNSVRPNHERSGVATMRLGYDSSVNQWRLYVNQQYE